MLLEEKLEIINNFRPIDDTFMRKIFDNHNRVTQEVLRIILERNDLIIEEAKAQKSLNSIRGHNVILDVCAKDSKNNHYDIEIQRAKDGADPKRARYNSSILDTNMLPQGVKYKDLKETYIIFFCENDIFKANKPLYHIERRIKELGYKIFEDFSHIIYVNGEYNNNDKIGLLIKDFFESDYKNIHCKELSNRVKELKTTESEIQNMCDAMEKIEKEGRKEGRNNLLKMQIKNMKSKLIEPLEIANILCVSLEEVLNIYNNL